MSLFVDIEKSLGDFVLKVSFTSENGVLSLMGKSGCGKSMTLKCIAGVEKPDRGKIVLDGVTLFDSEKKINLPPQNRRVGLLFQNYALFPNMTAIENIKAGANRIKNKAEKDAVAQTIMKSLGVSDLANHYPSQLSGGQQQRIALARILVSEPECLLLDEPFSALDTHLRFITERETARVIESFGKTVILVSHSIDEVFRLTDDIAVLNNGKIEAIGDKKEILSNPPTINSALLMGWSNISLADIIDRDNIIAKDWGLKLKVKNSHSAQTDTCYIAARAKSIRPATTESTNVFTMSVEAAANNPYDTSLLLKSPEGGKPLTCMVSKEWWNIHKSDTIRIHIPEEGLSILTDTRLQL